MPAESAASDLFYALTAYQNEFKKKRIFKIRNLSISEERLVQTKDDKILTEVDIDFAFDMQRSVRKGEKQSNCLVYVNGIQVYEGIDFQIVTNGTQIQFNVAPADTLPITITYVDANTLETRTDVAVGTGDGTTTIFTIPAAGAVYGYFTWLEGFDIYGPGITTLTLEDNYPDGGSETLSGLWAKVN